MQFSKQLQLYGLRKALKSELTHRGPTATTHQPDFQKGREPCAEVTMSTVMTLSFTIFLHLTGLRYWVPVLGKLGPPYVIAAFSPPANQWHLGGHDGHEQNVGVQRKARHVHNSSGNVVDIHGRLSSGPPIGL
jgi:hypothetical protein